tara:strand:+ start:18170 stop:19069 length:900 start_codon:yes stop_codon:yes gene_type:complete
MSEVLILGTVALDTIQTPFGKAENALGGSASYASFSASFFTQPSIVSVIGKDFPEEYLDLLKDRKINLDNIKIEDKTFRWSGSYEFDMNEAKTHSTELNSLATFKPEVNEELKNARYIFLANIDPDIQNSIIEQVKNPQLIVMDTMNFWIDSKKEPLLNVIKKVDVFILNEGEARQLFDTPNLVTAANKALELGPKTVIIKKGEHGAIMFMDNKHFNAPGFPLETVKDPTGAGDTFGGAITGYLAKTKDHSEQNFRKAIVYGSVLASFNAEDFSLNNLSKISQEDIEERFNQMKDIREF